jgi:hypothetical protein
MTHVSYYYFLFHKWFLFCSHLFYILFDPKPLVLFEIIAKKLKWFKSMQIFVAKKIFCFKNRKEKWFDKKKAAGRQTGPGQEAGPARLIPSARSGTPRRVEPLTGGARLSGASPSPRQSPPRTRLPPSPSDSFHLARTLTPTPSQSLYKYPLRPLFLFSQTTQRSTPRGRRIARSISAVPAASGGTLASHQVPIAAATYTFLLVVASRTSSSPSFAPGNVASSPASTTRSARRRKPNLRRWAPLPSLSTTRSWSDG